MSARAALLALDAGTGSLRAALFDLQGRLLAVASRPASFTTPPELDPFGKEFSTTRCLEQLADATREACASAGSPEIRAISTTGLRGGSVLLDSAGLVLAASPIADVRGMLVVGDVDGAVPDLYRRTGHSPTWLFPISRLLWYRSEALALFERVTTMVSIDEWLLFELSGERRCSATGAGDSMLFGVAARCWDTELFERLALCPSVVPPVADTGDVVGPLTAAAAARLGLPPGIPIVAGAGDTQASLLGARVLDPEHVGVVAGTTAPVMAVTSQPTLDPNGVLWTGCHALPDRWVLEGNSGRAGSSLDWALELLGLSDDTRYAALEQLAGAAAPASNRTFAFLGAEPVDLSNLNPMRPAGFLFPSPELGIPVGRGELLRAVLENVAFAVQANLRRIGAVVDVDGATLALCGGMSRSPLFAQTVADVSGRAVRVGSHGQTSALGAAMAAARGAGEFGSLREAADAMAAETTTFEPDAERRSIYQDAFDAWYERWQILRAIT